MQQASGDRSVHLQPDLGDRFQGALLGLGLAPTAVLAEGIEAIAPNRRLASVRLHRAIDDSLIQTSAFVSAPNTWRIDPAKLQDSTALLPACLPILLRYHHSWKNRLDWLSPLQSQVSIAQALVLGDLLEAMSIDLVNTDVMNAELIDPSALGWTAWLTQSAARYRIIPKVGDEYEAVLSALFTALSVEMNGTADNDDVLDEGVHQAFAMGVSSAIMHPQSYVLALRRLFGYAAIRTAFCDQTAELEDELAFAWVAVYVAGLLSGAWQGRGGLPALWQLHLDTDNRLQLAHNLADRLFCLWAGQLSSRGVLQSHLPH